MADPTKFHIRRKHFVEILGEMLGYLDNQNLTDVTLICSDGTKFNVHQKVLNQVSKVVRKFAASFPGNERINVVLPDYSNEIVRSLLFLIYTGSSTSIRKSDIKKLQELCHNLQITLSEDSLEIHPTSKNEYSDESDVDPLTNGEDSDDDSTDQTWSARQDYSYKNGSGSKSPTKHGKKSQGKKSPKSIEPPSDPLPADTSDKIFCLCRQPERPHMIGCDFCDEWFHVECLGLNKSEAKELTKKDWKCPNCEREAALLREHLNDTDKLQIDWKKYDAENDRRSSDKSRRDSAESPRKHKDHRHSSKDKSSKSGRGHTSDDGRDSGHEKRMKKMTSSKNTNRSNVDEEAKIPPKKRKLPMLSPSQSKPSASADMYGSQNASKTLFHCNHCSTTMSSREAHKAHKSVCPARRPKD